MTWIFLSPHLDDAVLSCGGLIYDLVISGQQVQIWTICAGDAPPGSLSPLALALHERWQTGPESPKKRRAEDELACHLLGAKPVHFDFPECIYRRHPITGQPVIGTNAELFQPLPGFEMPLMTRVSKLLSQQLYSVDKVVSPLAIGGHIDHHLVRSAAEMLGRPLYYYPDYPYHGGGAENLSGINNPDWTATVHAISKRALAAWQQAVAAYRSQISTFWGSIDEMKSALQAYRKQGGGNTLWFTESPN